MRIVKIIILLIAISGIASYKTVGGAVSVDIDSDIFNQWIEIVKKVHTEARGDEGQIYNIIAENFYQKYRETSNPVYLNFALHEAGRALREEIIVNLSEEEFARISDVIDKMHYRNIPSGYYKIREFGPSDIYTFVGLDIPDEMSIDALALLNHWYNSFDESFAKDPLLATFKAQALSSGYAKLEEYEKASEQAPYLLKYNVFPSSEFSYTVFSGLTYPLYMRGNIHLPFKSLSRRCSQSFTIWVIQMTSYIHG